MLATYKQFVERQRLWEAGDKVLLAVSGGPDSVAMVELTARLGIEFGISHVNFGLRGEESDGDEAFVRELAKRYDVPIVVTRVDTMRYVDMKGVSVEMAAREIRYAEFNRVMDIDGYKVVAVAHHKDDALETFFLNLLRGSGIRGLTGMRVRNGRVVRPMLCFTRSEIEEFLSENQMTYRTDSSNLGNEFARNKIRNLALPIMDDIAENARASITESIGYLGMAKRIYDHAIDEAVASVVSHEGSSIVVNIRGILNFVEPECLLFEILGSYDFGKAQCREVFRKLKSSSGKIFYSNTHRLVKDRNTLIITHLNDVETVAGRGPLIFCRSNIDKGMLETHSWRLNIELIDCDAFAPERDPYTVYFDMDKLCFPMTITGWERGDSFVPFGSHCHKKLSDLFIDQKLSIDDKDSVEILRCGGKILWVIGIRAANDCCVQPSTKQILKIKAVRKDN
ncbi:MAG: tRNA lysidine(34) synthetase TilS [Bacteroidales bacterium]|nr:tRNA lysidine(34) synthetase TilS [Bacteroidales bacterium]